MRGFTLLELLVVIAIIGILAIVIVPSYNEYSKNQKLDSAAGQLQSVLRQAQNNAQTGTVCKIGGTTYKASSWKVTLNSDRYSVLPVCVGASSPASQEYLLPSGVTISEVRDPGPDCSVIPSSNPPTIEYTNLSSEVLFNLSGCSPGVNAVIEITLNLDSSSKIVQVEKGGGIYVKK